jgi:hypothetical protein
LLTSQGSPPLPHYAEKLLQEEDGGPQQLDSREMDRGVYLDSAPVHELGATEAAIVRERMNGRNSRAERTETEGGHVMSWAHQGGERLSVDGLEGTLQFSSLATP